MLNRSTKLQGPSPIKPPMVSYSDVNNQSISQLVGVAGLLLVFCTLGCGFDPSQCRLVFMMPKIDRYISCDYAACKKSFDYLFDLDALGKIKSQGQSSHHQRSGTSL
ncbi:hypothetical protein TNCV_3071231 [Trichonephila clavipes]|nr:hypothetical protein TNCV_3071231 [Trichonephila clavipes]